MRCSSLRIGLATAIALTLAIGLADPSFASWTPRKDLLTWMNRDRGPNLIFGWRLNQRAHTHSLKMARQGRIFHSALHCYCGENVGVGPRNRLKELYNAFMASAPHRANILNRDWHRVGIAVVPHDGYLWVTIRFKP